MGIKQHFAGEGGPAMQVARLSSVYFFCLEWKVFSAELKVQQIHIN